MKSNEDGILLFDNFIHGSDLLFLYIAMLLTAMIVHGFAPHDFIKHHAIYQSQKEQMPLQLTPIYYFYCLFYFSYVSYCAIEPVLISANQK